MPRGIVTKFGGLMDYVALGDLTIDAAYQRAVNVDLVADIAAAFNDKAFGSLLVSLRDTVYYVLDGQQRLTACKALNWPVDELVPCMVHTGMTQKEEANLFVLINRDRRSVAFADQHKAGLVAEHEQALEVERLVRAAGMRVVNHKKALAAGEIRCIRKLTLAYRQAVEADLVPAFERGLALINRVYNEHQVGRGDRWVNCVLAFCVKYHGQYELAKMADLLRAEEADPLDLYTAIYRTVGGGNGWKLVVERLKAMYDEYVETGVVRRQEVA